MPPIRPKPAEGGWWAVVQDLKDGNFALETISFGLFKVITGTNSSPPFRIILCGSNYEIARAWTKEEALQDWGWAQAKYEEEVHLVGSTKFSDHHFLALFEALWQHDHPEDAPQDTKKEAVFCPELFDGTYAATSAFNHAHLLTGYIRVCSFATEQTGSCGKADLDQGTRHSALAQSTGRASAPLLRIAR
jgi:hypothetical protein